MRYDSFINSFLTLILIAYAFLGDLNSCSGSVNSACFRVKRGLNC